MLSYPHQYHAGSFADVHKHLIMRVLFESLLKKDKPFCYLDCHAGSGVYDLKSAASQKTAERVGGIDQLWHLNHKNSTLQAYLDAIKSLNEDTQLRYYPGSPKLAANWLREQDRAQLIELHPQAQDDLRRTFTRDKKISLHARDCYEGLPAIIPPQIKRGFVLLDPSYEVKDEYTQIVKLVEKAHTRWATAIYAIWYPLLPSKRHLHLLDALKRAKLPKVLISELHILDQDKYDADRNHNGMVGSGMAIINTPWQVDDKLSDLLPYVAETLAPGFGSSHLVDLD